jgi:cell division protein FtsN
LLGKKLFFAGAKFIIFRNGSKKLHHYRSPGNPVKPSISQTFSGKANMIAQQRYLNTFLILSFVVAAGCGTADQIPKKSPHLGLIATPTTYYSTQKAKYLGEKYKSNLDRIVERIVRNPKTANLQFANNIASVGGIGFFTHSAARSVDERFLEVILGAPETFDNKMDFSAKVSRIFSLYGTELLSMLASDPDIYQEKEVSGYGLNVSWRNVVADASGSRIGLERTILYFSKAKVRSFLKGDLVQNNLLGEAVIFAIAEEGPMKLVSYRPEESKPDLRSPIQEETIAAGTVRSKPEPKGEAIAPLAREDRAVHEEDKSLEGLSPRLSGESPDPMTIHSERKEGSIEIAEPMKEPTDVAIVYSPASLAPPMSTSPLEQAKEVELPTKQVDNAVDSAPFHDQVAAQPIVAESDVQPVQIARLPSSGDDVPNSETLLEIQEAPRAETKSADAAPRALSAAIPPPRQVLHGFVIQIAFAEKSEAQRWAEILDRRGHAISMTETGDNGRVRLRIGSFAGRDEAEQQLQTLRRDGLKGIILNFPQAYRPAIPASEAEDKEQASSASE